MPAKGRRPVESDCRLSLTNSSRSCFLECPRKYFWAYRNRLNRSGGESYPLLLGSVFHESVAAAYALRTGGADVGLDDAKAVAAVAVEEHISGRLADPDSCAEYQIAEAEAACAEMAKQYLDRWWEVDKQYAVSLVEQDLRYRLNKSVELRGKVDIVFVDKDGDAWVVDHKTTSRFDTNYAAAIQSDTQLLRYGLMLQTTGEYRVVGSLYDVIVKPKRMDKNQTAVEYAAALSRQQFKFVRVQVESSKAFAAEMFAEDAAVAESIMRCDATGVWPKNAPAACSGRYSFNTSCPFMQLCAVGATVTEAVEMYGYAQRKSEHPELDG